MSPRALPRLSSPEEGLSFCQDLTGVLVLCLFLSFFLSFLQIPIAVKLKVTKMAWK